MAVRASVARVTAEDSQPSTTDDPNTPSDPNSMGMYFAPKEFRYSTTGSLLTESNPCVSVVAAGDKFLYVLPGFDVLAIELRHIQIKGSQGMGSPDVKIVKTFFLIPGGRIQAERGCGTIKSSTTWSDSYLGVAMGRKYFRVVRYPRVRVHI